MELGDKNILVTGAGGFIGSHLTDRLIDTGANVLAFLRYNSSKNLGFINEISEQKRKHLKITFGDICDLDAIQNTIKNNKIDTIFHLAASISVPYSFEHPQEVIKINAHGTLDILLAARENGVGRVITTSSSEVYGTARFIPITEDHPLQSQSPYAASKIAGDKYAESFFNTYGLPVTIVRPFNTYGARQSARAVIPTIITQALTGNNIKIGSLTPRRDFLYVKDCIEGYIKIAEEDEVTKGKVINLATGKDTSIGDVCRLVKNILSIDIPVISNDQRIRPSNAEVNILCGDATRAKDFVGWESKVNLKEGLEETIKWIKANLHLFRPTEYSI